MTSPEIKIVNFYCCRRPRVKERVNHVAGAASSPKASPSGAPPAGSPQIRRSSMIPEPRIRILSFGSDAGSISGDETPPERERVRVSVWNTVSAYGGYWNYALHFAPASTIIVLMQIILYFGGEPWFDISSEEDVRVSWEKVIEDGEYKRLALAHLCHFTWYHLVLNAIGLITVGRYIERKFKFLFTLGIIEVLGIAANLLYCIFTKKLGYPTSTSISGFSHIFYGLRMFVSYCQEPRNYEPGLFLGLYPAYLSSTWAPWQPALEIFLLKLMIEEMNVCGHCSGFLTGFIFAFLILLVPKGIARRRSRHLLLEQPQQAELEQEQNNQ